VRSHTRIADSKFFIIFHTILYLILKTGGIGEVIVGALQLLFIVILAAFVLDLVIHLTRKLPTLFVFAALASCLGNKVLNDANLIPRDDHEQITKVLVSAFLDTSLKNKSD
jgi:hypothetical protein